jgi:carbamoyltransferase
MYILGLTTMGESAAALLRDGEILACAEEERFSRRKHHIGFPVRAASYCLSEAGITMAEVEHVAHYWQPWILCHRVVHTLGALARGFDLFHARLKRGSSQVRGYYLPMFYMPWQVRQILGRSAFRFHYVEHHVSHAASSFFCSQFDEAAILSFDGAGEEATVFFGHGQGNKIKPLRRIKLPHSLGQFYSAATNFLGFDMFEGDEYKVMGMAGWGEPTTAAYLEREVLVCDGPGSFRLDVTFLDHHLAKHRKYSERARRLWGEPRGQDESPDQRQYDVAASVQKAFEDTLYHLLNWLYKQTGCRNLCLAGGCALNSVANGKITSRTPFDNLYLQPAAHDGGGALGAALFIHHCKLGGKHRNVMRHAYWGPGFSESRCRKTAESAHLQPRLLRTEELYRSVANLIAEGKIVAWFQGRMEWGPRALGNRSFLADPRRPDMKEIINRKIKQREPFRPFAPSLLSEASERYFGRQLEAPFMITVFPVLGGRIPEIPAVVHVDGTARPQLVDREVNPRYWSLIKAFDECTGVPVLLNTSFNVREPIVCTPEDAVRTFLASEVDCLVMGDLLVPRPASGTC